MEALKQAHSSTESSGLAPSARTRFPEIEAYLSAEERAQVIEAEIKNLASPMSALTPHAYKTERQEFDRLDQLVQAGLHRVEAMVVGLRMAADSEYAPSPWHMRLLLWTFSFIGGVHRVRQAIVKSRRRHEARIAAAEGYQKLVDDYRQQIEDIRYAKVNLRTKELLLANREYQELMQEIPELEEKIANTSSPDYERRLENHLERINKEALGVRNGVRAAVLKEFSDEDF